MNPRMLMPTNDAENAQDHFHITLWHFTQALVQAE